MLQLVGMKYIKLPKSISIFYESENNRIDGALNYIAIKWLSDL